MTTPFRSGGWRGYAGYPRRSRRAGGSCACGRGFEKIHKKVLSALEADDKIVAALEGDPLYGNYREIQDCPPALIEHLRHLGAFSCPNATTFGHPEAGRFNGGRGAFSGRQAQMRASRRRKLHEFFSFRAEKSMEQRLRSGGRQFLNLGSVHRKTQPDINPVAGQEYAALHSAQAACRV